MTAFLERVTMKFGGSSVRDAEAIQQVVALVERTLDGSARQAVVVVSAMEGTTDLLEAGARAAAARDEVGFRQVVDELRAKHLEAASRLTGATGGPLRDELERLMEAFEALGERLAELGEAPPKLLDQAMGLGERLVVRLLAAALRQAGRRAEAIEATSLIVTDDRFQDAAPLAGPTREGVRSQLAPLLSEGVIPVVTGFIGATVDGQLTTLGRGGSDYSAALVGAGLNCDEVWIWTDVDGVMSVDPKVVPAAHALPVLSYREVSELAYFGAKVLHPKTILPVIEAGIPLRVKNTFRPAAQGTVVLPESQDRGRQIKAVTAVKDIGLVTLEGRGMLGVPGIAARAFAAVAREGANVLLISQASSEQTICFAVPDSHAARVVAALEREFERELARQDIDRIWVDEPMAIVTVVGAGMRSTPGVAGRVFTALGQRGINVVAIAQGSSECSLSLVVAGEEVNGAIFALHNLTEQSADRAA